MHKLHEVFRHATFEQIYHALFAVRDKQTAAERGQNNALHTSLHASASPLYDEDYVDRYTQHNGTANPTMVQAVEGDWSAPDVEDAGRTQKGRCVSQFVDGKFADPDVTRAPKESAPLAIHDLTGVRERTHVCPGSAEGDAQFRTRITRKGAGAPRCDPPGVADFAHMFAAGDDRVMVQVDKEADVWQEARVIKAPRPNADDRVRVEWKKGVTNDPWFVVELDQDVVVGPRRRMRVMRNRVRPSQEYQDEVIGERDRLKTEAEQAREAARGDRESERRQQGIDAGDLRMHPSMRAPEGADRVLEQHRALVRTEARTLLGVARNWQPPQGGAGAAASPPCTTAFPPCTSR
eukprot:jgi/Mesvir1/28526/Mv17797-RA.1